MPFIFPKRVLQTGDVLAKADMNADWQPIGEVASGGLDGQNLSSSLSSTVAVADGAFHKAYHVYESVDPGFGDNTGYVTPTLAAPPTDAWIVPVTSNWAAVGGMSITSIITGVSNLWIVGWTAYVYYGFVDSDASRGAHLAQNIVGGREDAGLQLALRVDGQVLPETITGFADDRYRSCQPLKPTSQRDAGNATATLRNAPGPGLYPAHTIRGHGPQAGAIRIVANAPVGPGNHTVELVARIVQTENPLLSPLSTHLGVGLHNRQLFVLDCPVHPNSAPSRTAVEVPAFDDATVVSTANMATNRMNVLTTALNDLDAGHLQRGAFGNQHLPDVPLDVMYTWITPGSPVEYNSKYPGYDTDTIAPSRIGNLVGWSWVVDPAGPKYLRTSEDIVRPAGDIVTNGVDCLLIVMADVQLHEIDGGIASETSTQTTSICCFGAFALANRRSDTGDTNVFGLSEAQFNNHVDWAYAAGAPVSRPIEINVPLFMVYNLSPQTLPVAGTEGLVFNLTDIGVVASAFRTSVIGGGGAVTFVPDVFCQRGALTVIQLRG